MVVREELPGEPGIVHTVPGRKIIITLGSNPTTGFSWQLKNISDKQAIEFLNSEYIPSSENLISAGGRERWTFGALKPGRAEIIMEYKRPWEKGVPAEKEQKITVFVDKAEY